MAPLPSRAAVLVADDEPLTRWALLQTLEGLHLDVTLASSREEVCRLLETRHFRVAVVAHELGQNSMGDVLDALARGPQASGLVILCGGDDADEVRQAFPMATVLQKPFCLEAVTAAVTASLEPSSEAC